MAREITNSFRASLKAKSSFPMIHVTTDVNVGKPNTIGITFGSYSDPLEIIDSLLESGEPPSVFLEASEASLLAEELLKFADDYVRESKDAKES